ncbi:hypothetical protein EV186_102438 [Labedaea rhizosphaerae]|uniref:Uncharacterized protein n=1 Tax=Labedaea rhizosphaerae TaxID=598644 RepID=A0A4R6SGA9_LABRH|nr:hypothetical protein EV186_102438 [Labedaea rhizosphaerae]
MLSWFKESATLLIALAVVAVTGWLLIDHYLAIQQFQVDAALIGNHALYAAKQQAYQQFLSDQQNVVNIAIGILGVVLGYYFGRVPAELRAKKAEDVAQSTADAAAGAVDESKAAGAKLADVKATLGAISGRPGGAGLLGAGQDRAKIEIDALLRRLG